MELKPGQRWLRLNDWNAVVEIINITSSGNPKCVVISSCEKHKYTSFAKGFVGVYSFSYNNRDTSWKLLPNQDKVCES